MGKMEKIRECQKQEEISQGALSMGRRKERREVARVKMECVECDRLGSWPFWKLAQVYSVDNPWQAASKKLDD